MSLVVTERIEIASEFSKSIVGELAEFCKKYGIHTLGYRKFLADGSSFGLSNNNHCDAIFRNYLNQIFIKEYDEAIKEICKEASSRYYLRIGIPNESQFLNMLYDNDIWNTLCYYVPNLQTQEITAFFLSTSRENKNILEVYLNHSVHIQQFFTKLDAQWGGQLESYKTSNLFSHGVVNPFSILRQEQLSYKLCVDGRIVNISEQEGLAFSELFLIGKNRQTLAQSWLVSPKTIDTYVERLKKKTKTLSKNQLMKMCKEGRVQLL
ncbi:MAG: hypothetical protein ACKOAD_02515 [Gammaproteobacteria bacterium]